MTILKVTKNQGFILSQENKILDKLLGFISLANNLWKYQPGCHCKIRWKHIHNSQKCFSSSMYILYLSYTSNFCTTFNIWFVFCCIGSTNSNLLQPANCLKTSSVFYFEQLRLSLKVFQNDCLCASLFASQL